MSFARLNVFGHSCGIASCSLWKWCVSDKIDVREAPMWLTDWHSWKMKRVCRSSLAPEAQSNSESVDFSGVCLAGRAGKNESAGVDVNDALKRIETSRQNLSEKRTSIEFLTSCLRRRQLALKALWVNWNIQLRDTLKIQSI